MGAAIEYQKLMREIVYINLPGPQEPSPGMNGGDLLHGFLAELCEAASPEVKSYINSLRSKWNIHYRESTSQPATPPPSTGRATPVIKEASGDTKNKAP